MMSLYTTYIDLLHAFGNNYYALILSNYKIAKSYVFFLLHSLIPVHDINLFGLRVIYKFGYCIFSNRILNIL